MERLAEFIISIAELAEAEGRELKKNFRAVLRSAVMVFFAFQLFFAGILAALYAIYLLIAGVLGRPAAALIIATLFFLIGYCFMKNAHRDNLPTKNEPQSEGSKNVPKIAE